jgi:hypothetical protein
MEVANTGSQLTVAKNPLYLNAGVNSKTRAAAVFASSSRGDGGDLARPPRQQCREPRPMPAAVDLGIANDGKRPGHEQAAQIAVALFVDTAKPVLAPTRVLLRHEPDPGREAAA